MKSIGIDIGSSSIKIAELNSNRKSTFVSQFVEYPLSPQVHQDKNLEIIEILRQAATQFDFANSKVVMSLPQNQVSLRRKAFPFRELPKIIKSLVFELEDEVPFDLEEVVLDAKICEFQGSAAHVMICAANNDQVEAQINRAAECYLDPDILSADGFALANLIENWSFAPPENTNENEQILDFAETTNSGAPKGPATQGRLILQIGHTQSILLCYNERSLMAVRSILWGGLDIAKKIALAFNLPIHEAIKILKTKSFLLLSTAGSSSDQIKLSDAIGQSIQEMSQELKFSILELKTIHNLSFDQLEIMGGVSQIQNIGPYLTQQIELPTNHFHFFDRLATQFQPTPEIIASSGVAIGLAIEGLKTIRNPSINLRRGLFIKENKSFNQFIEKWKPALISSSIAVVLIFAHAITRDSLSGSLQEASEAELTKQSKVVNKTSTTVAKYIDEQNKMIRSREELAKYDRYQNAMDILGQLSKKLPQNQKDQGLAVSFDITRLNIDNDELFMEGKVNNSLHLKLIEKTLKSFTTGEVKNTNPIGQNFSYRLKLQRLNND